MKVEVDLLVVGAEGLVVYVEKEVTASIGVGGDDEFLGNRGGASCLEVVVWCR